MGPSADEGPPSDTGRSTDKDTGVDEADEESFPASDAPSGWSGRDKEVLPDATPDEEV
ncbi:MAG TPA: hypothetical protein VGL48_17430 [Acidimicrobiales bacterium]